MIPKMYLYAIKDVKERNTEGETKRTRDSYVYEFVVIEIDKTSDQEAFEEQARSQLAKWNMELDDVLYYDRASLKEYEAFLSLHNKSA